MTSPRVGLILANRAYVDHDGPEGGVAAPSPGSGGLLTTLGPTVTPWDGRTGTIWVGAGQGRFDHLHVDPSGYETLLTPAGPLRHRRLFFDGPTWMAHYSSVSNAFLWPLLHLVSEPLHLRTSYYPAPATPATGSWDAYRRVNRAFAQAALAAPANDACWIHDYQLALAPAMLREAGFGRLVGFFLHTPFPALELVRDFDDPVALACMREFAQGILGAHLAGFQTQADLARFARFCESFGAVADGETITFRGHRTAVGVFPVGVDANAVLETAGSEARRDDGLPLVAGIERCDFTKGIPERLEAVARGLRERLPFRYEGIAAPTRRGLPAYERLRDVVDDAASACRAVDATRFGHAFEARPWSEVVAMQRNAAVVFTSSLSDGMNLVPMQAALAQKTLPRERRGVLIAGRDAGVAATFPGAERDGLVTVDPLDGEAMFATLRAAVLGELPRISDRLIDAILARDAKAWATEFLSALEAYPC
ncbi:MAG: trehalose-6-phosphate synthase [Dehalococcoidia bacterium]